jgi:hypothetical protein
MQAADFFGDRVCTKLMAQHIANYISPTSASNARNQHTVYPQTWTATDMVHGASYGQPPLAGRLLAVDQQHVESIAYLASHNPHYQVPTMACCL